MEEKEQPKWYILHTYSGYEAIVKDNLEKLIENNNLGDYIVDVKVLTDEEIVEDKKGRKKIVERKLLPSYVFIKMIYTNQIWYYVTSTRGVTGFCGPQGHPIPMKKEEILKMGLEKADVDTSMAVGDTVSIEEGPLKGFFGKITELNMVVNKAKVKTTMFGRETDVEVDLFQIRKVDAELPAPKEETEENN